MWAYIARRLLLIPLTLLGITLIVFALTRLVPGGPLERALMEIQMGGHSKGVSTSPLSEEQLSGLKTYYGLDQPWPVAYGHWILKIMQGDLGESQRYNDPVWDMVIARLPISLFYGLTAMILTYGICVPLGILKAMKPHGWLDKGSSIMIFLGYALPNYVLGSFLLVVFAGYLDWFPLGGFISDDFETLTFWKKIQDLIHHSILPLCCYLVGSFAFVTLLIRNTLIEQLAADFMRTAIAKGLSFKQAVWRHGLRNALVPLATDFGQNLTLVLSGSFLIETLFDIDGFGLLGYNAILDRDYPIVMGILFLSALLFLLGNLISDLLLAWVDPRVRFQ